MSLIMNDEVQMSARNIALKSVERNARQLLSDAELLFDHGGTDVRQLLECWR
jgi:hypothetical protein